MAQSARSAKIRTGALLLTLVGVALALLFAGLFYYYGYADYGPAQPVPFSHRLHAGVKAMDCRFCHPFVEYSSNAGVPSVKKCFFCHEYIIPEHPEIRKELSYYDAGNPVPWKRLFIVQDHVLFQHQAHIRRGVDCIECHGDVKAMDRLPYHEFEMGFCIRCHRAEGASLSCWLACHN